MYMCHVYVSCICMCICVICHTCACCAVISRFVVLLLGGLVYLPHHAVLRLESVCSLVGAPMRNVMGIGVEGQRLEGREHRRRH
jgi:hypothetical protein